MIISIFVPEQLRDQLTKDNLWQWYCSQLVSGSTTRAVENDIDQFVNALCDLDGDRSVGKSELYGLYCIWTTLDRPPSREQFGRMMTVYNLTEHRPTVNGERVRCWRGIGLKD